MTTTEPTMSVEQSSLLRAILTHPEDDTARLVYADWLQEQGQEPLARWIRSRVSAPDEEVTLGPSDSVMAFGGTVAYGIRDFAGKGVFKDGKLHYRRGFVESVTCTAADWLRHADSLVWHPKQTVECLNRMCGGRGWWMDYYTDGIVRSRRKTCPTCSGKGRISRRIPATAQPITRVVLTTTPPLRDWGPLSLWDEEFPGRQEMEFRHARWPGITFRLEATDAPPGEGPDEGRMN